MIIIHSVSGQIISNIEPKTSESGWQYTNNKTYLTGVFTKPIMNIVAQSTTFWCRCLHEDDGIKKTLILMKDIVAYTIMKEVQEHQNNYKLLG
jgi:hypothetical protein